MKAAWRGLLAAAALVFANQALAWHIEGYIVCEGTGARVSGVKIDVQGSAGGVAFSGSSTSDADGFYIIYLPEVPGSYTATADLAGVGGGSVVSPPQPFAFDITDAEFIIYQDWVVNVLGCGKAACWLTGGGAKFSTIAGIPVAEHGPKVSFGGNVNPGCSPIAGEGGQWSHVDHELKLFFQGTAITVDECGNVSGIPPGSTSPVTPYNFITYHGTGTLKGIAGNKYEKIGACFSARAEDRNEPGSSGTRDGAYVDRYFLRVYDCDTNAELLVLEEPPADSGLPTPITDGNMQIHISSCAP